MAAEPTTDADVGQDNDDDSEFRTSVRLNDALRRMLSVREVAQQVELTQRRARNIMRMRVEDGDVEPDEDLRPDPWPEVLIEEFYEQTSAPAQLKFALAAWDEWCRLNPDRSRPLDPNL